MMLDKRGKKGSGRQDITDGVTSEMYNHAKEQAMILRSIDPTWIERNQAGLVKLQANGHADKLAAAQALCWQREGERDPIHLLIKIPAKLGINNLVNNL